MTAWAAVTQGDQRRADVVILTAIKLEFDAVLKVEAGAVAGSSWEEATGPSGLPVAYRQFVGKSDRPLRVAVALAPDMGATAAVNTLLPLVAALRPRCVAMCGVCAGRREKVALGDVVAADRLYYHDTGKQQPGRVEQDLRTYNQRGDWKIALERMDPVALFGGEAWFLARPLTTEWRAHRTLVSIGNSDAAPWTAADPTMTDDEWQEILAELKERKLVAASGRTLTAAGRRFVDELRFAQRGKLPDVSPAGPQHPLRLHVAPIGSGARVVEDEQIWTFVSQAMRKTLGIEMEAAAIGELAHHQRQHQLDWVVMKGVMDFADHGRDDHFKEYAARVSAECLLWFLREHLATDPVAGFDDVLTPGTLALPPNDVPPSMLLAAPFTFVPWHQAGRDEVMAQLDRWADDPSRAVAVRLLHAEGGVGKTRLAIEWLKRRRGEDGESDRRDIAGFLPPKPVDGWADGWLERLCTLSAPVVIAMDYAETRADLVSVLARVAAARALKPERRIHVLLLARSDGDWWEALRQRDLGIKTLLMGDEPIALTPLAASPVDRQAVFAEALKAFAARKQRPAPEATIEPDDPRFARVLYLQVAALVAVERSAAVFGAAHDVAAPIVLKADALMNDVLDHEQRFWRRDPHDSSPDLESLAQQLIAAATLRGGLSKPEAWKLCERLMARTRTHDEDELLALLHQVYASSGSSKYLPGLQPDLLGEAMVLRVAAAEQANAAWIERVIAPGDDAHALTTAFTVLERAATTNATLVHPWIEQLLRTDLPVRAVLALRVAKAVGLRTALSSLGDLLADALARDGFPGVAQALAKEGIPYPTVSLRRVAEWSSRVQLTALPQGEDGHALAARATRLNASGVSLREVGQREAALTAIQEAVNIRRALATTNPDAFAPDLALSLTNLGNLLSELGQREAALAASQEAVDVRRALAANNPGAFAPDLALSLTNLGIRLGGLGERERALAVTEEAVDHYRVLAATNSDAFAPDLARSLTNLGIRLNELGQHKHALAVAQEAVDRYRALAATNPDAFAPELACSLTNLGTIASALGKRERALTATQEAVDHHRAFAASHPNVFASDLATSLTNLGNHLSELGQHEHALTATQEAVDICRALVSTNPDAFAPNLALSLNNLGLMLSEMGQHERALAAAQEAVDIRRALATQHPDAFTADLAMSLNNLGGRLTGLGRHEAALAAIQKAVGHYRVLVAQYPDAFGPGLAGSLTNLGTIWNTLGQREPALAATQEAVGHYRVLVAQHPDAFAPDFARSLTSLGTIWNALGQHEAALAATHEAWGHFRALAANTPDAFTPDLARSLLRLGIRLSALGQHETALAAIQEAVGRLRALAANTPDTFAPDLARSLASLSIPLSELGQHEVALAATQEAVDHFRALTATNPDEFATDLAMSLIALSLRLNELGQHEPALAATQEAADHFRALAAKRPDAFLPDLAARLNNLASLHARNRRPRRRKRRIR